MTRLLGLLIALGLGLWAQRTLTGPEPGIPRDALILFILASIVFLWNARPPRRLRRFAALVARPWRRAGLVLSLLGLAAGLVSLVLLWFDLGSALGLLLWPLATVLFVTGTFLEGRRDAGREAAGPAVPATTAGRPPARSGVASWLSAHWDLLLLAAVLAVAVLVRFYQLDIIPNGCQSDECNNGLDALRWLGGAPYQPFAETNEGQATLFTYLIALSFKLFGVGVTQMRAVSAAVGVVTVLAFYFLARDHYGRKAALVAAALLATARWHVTFSRIVYELIMQPLFMVLVFLFLLRGLREGRRRDWALAGLSLAVGLNTYTAFRVVPLLVAAFLAFWLLRSLIRERPWRRVGGPRPRWRGRYDLQGMAIMAGSSVLAVLPLGVYVVQNWQIFTSRMQHISVLQDVAQAGSNQPIIDNLRKFLYMFNWQGDGAALNNLPGAPMLDTVVGVLFVLGLAYALWYSLRARSLPVLYVLWFVAVGSLAVLSVAHEAPTARRTIGMIPLAYLLVALFADQLLLAWQDAWGHAGQRGFSLAVAGVVALIAFGNARTYFSVQAANPSVWNAFSPSESAVGEYLATLPPGATILITPQYEHHSAIKLIGRDHPHRALDPVDDLPYRSPVSGELIYVLEPVDEPLLSLLRQIYPGGTGQEHQDRYGHPLFLSYTVPQADLAATQGLVGQFYSTYPPTEAPEATQPVTALDMDMSRSPLAPPFFAIWEGTLLVPAYGQYRFDLLVEGEAASLAIGESSRLALDSGGQGSMDATLAAGFHPFRLEYRSGQQPGRLRLTWSGPEFADQVVAGDVLYTFDLGGQGLVGYYYPNADWQGPPSLVRNDLLIVPNNPLREPFSILWRGKIAIPQDGVYTFGTRSDDGSYLSIDGQLVVDNGGSHGAQDRQGSIRLERGFHDIEVRYNELGGSREMQLWWQPPGQGRAIIDGSYLFPLEGDAIPEGLALPPAPEIGVPRGGAEPGAGPVAGPEARAVPAAPADAGAVVQSGDFPVLAGQVIWSYGVCGSGTGQLSSPHGVAVDPDTGDVFVADSGNFRVVKIGLDGSGLAAWGEVGEGPDQFQEPADLVVEPEGTVAVLDAVGQRLLRFTPQGQFVGTFGGELAFYRPRGVGVDPAGQLWIADTGGVRIVALDSGGQMVGQVGGRETDLAQQQPTDAAATAGGDLTFVEAESGVVTRVGAQGDVTRWTGPRQASTIDGPHLALRRDGGLYVTDPEGQRVLLFDAQGQPLGQFGAEAALQKPVGVAVRADGQDDVVVVSDSQACRVVAFRVAGEAGG